MGSWSIYRHAQGLAEVFPRDSIVYLSPDAEEALEVCACIVLVLGCGMLTV